MSRGQVERVMVRRMDGSLRTVPDEVIVEEPLEIRIDNTLLTTTMRTPGHDFELAAGYCHGEGLLTSTTVERIRYCATGSAVTTAFNVVTVETRDRATGARPRLSATSSSCGLCGSATIEELTTWLEPLVPPVSIKASAAVAASEAASRAQPLFRRTGTPHAAAAFSLEDGAIVHLREDIGRHNAADKVIGRLYLDGLLPASGLGLFLSGRVSLEMVQKAWAAGFGMIAAVGGPSSLAVSTARTAGLALVAFLRHDRMTVYTGAIV